MTRAPLRRGLRRSGVKLRGGSRTSWYQFFALAEELGLEVDDRREFWDAAVKDVWSVWFEASS